MTEQPRELTDEECLLAAGSVAWDSLPANVQEQLREKLRREHPAQVKDFNKAIRAGRQHRKAGGAKK